MLTKVAIVITRTLLLTLIVFISDSFILIAITVIISKAVTTTVLMTITVIIRIAVTVAIKLMITVMITKTVLITITITIDDGNDNYKCNGILYRYLSLVPFPKLEHLWWDPGSS